MKEKLEVNRTDSMCNSLRRHTIMVSLLTVALAGCFSGGNSTDLRQDTTDTDTDTEDIGSTKQVAALETLRRLLERSEREQGLRVLIPVNMELEDVDFLGIVIEPPFTAREARAVLEEVVLVINALDIRRLALVGTIFEETDYVILRETPGLEWLTATEVSRQGMEYIGSLRALKHLTLSNATISKADLEHLRRAPLHTIDLSSSEITDSAIEALVDITTLTGVDLSSTRITDATMPHLAQMKLKHLDLANTTITDDGLRLLPGGLALINISNTRVTDVGLAAVLEKSPGLKVLFAKECRITDTAFANAKLASMEWLNLDETQVTDKAIPFFVAAPRLKRLSLYGTHLTDDSVRHLVRFRHRLHTLSVGNTKISQAGLKELKDALPHCGVETETRKEEGQIEPGVLY